MRRNKLTPSAGTSLVSAIVWGVAAAIILSILLTILVSSLALNGTVDGMNIGAMILIIRTLTVMIGGIIGGLIIKGKYILQVGLTTLCYLLIMFSLGVMLYGGNIGRLFTGVLTALLGGVLALLILSKPKKKSHRAIKLT